PDGVCHAFGDGRGQRGVVGADCETGGRWGRYAGRDGAALGRHHGVGRGLMPTLMGKRERWLWMTADEMKRYPPGEHDELIFGRNWDGPWQTAPNAWQVRSIDEIDYTPGPHDDLDGGTGWDGG